MSEESQYLIHGKPVSKEAYEQHDIEVKQLVKERDATQSRLDLYRSLTFCLTGLLALVCFLNSCVSWH